MMENSTKTQLLSPHSKVFVPSWDFNNNYNGSGGALSISNGIGSGNRLYGFFRIHEAAMSKIGNIEEMRP